VAFAGPEFSLSTIINSYLTSLLTATQSAYGGASTSSGQTQTGSEEEAASTASSPSTTVTLSEAAKAYLAAAAEYGDVDIPLAVVAESARAWFDAQYETLGIDSAMLDGKVAVDLTPLDRATLSAVASNAEDLFSDDEAAAAKSALDARFEDAIAPHVVIARHTGNYAALYQAALDYLDKAGSDEQATAAWQKERKAVAEGLAVAKAAFGKAPDTCNANDPVRALLDKTTTTGSAATDDDTSTVAGRARAMLDDQINQARDDGAELQLNPNRKTAHDVDFTDFDNRTLATMVLNADSTFSQSEVFAAKHALDQRARDAMLQAVQSDNGAGSGSLALIGVYSKMSAEEKSVLGVTDAVMNRVSQNYQTQVTVQNALSGSLLGLSQYL
jgi:hypothetical protein